MSGRLATPVVSGKTGSHIEGQMPGGWEQRQRTPLTVRYAIYFVYWYKSTQKARRQQLDVASHRLRQRLPYLLNLLALIVQKYKS